MRFAIFFMLLTLSIPAFAKPVDFTAMQPCARDSECVVVEPVCPGPWLAINRAHEAMYKRDLPNAMTHADCLMMENPQAKPAMPPVCKAGKCALK
ncbi:MAG: hypothetical protein ACT4OY_04665 [Alphaproteobacteria bacterium]